MGSPAPTAVPSLGTAALGPSKQAGIAELRNQALILAGFAGALRRSEIVGLDAEDVSCTKDGLVLRLRATKGDPLRRGQEVGVPCGRAQTCPVRALEGYLDAARISSGPVFRAVDRHGRVSPDRLTPRSVTRLVKEWAASIGLDPTQYSAHSPRSGFATAAAQAGRSERDIMRHGRWRSVSTASIYIRHVELGENPARGLL